MRHLSKIVFINSADKSLKYAEVHLDGNVHFIGTQGVGKSTLLRAILFFYNADTQKLGIPREKKNYNEYYFPFQNSYIIYEVQTEKGPFCVATFKVQGRVAFRFIEAEYDKKYFIDTQGKAYETWDKTREALGKIGSSRLVNSYDEYRNIIYGNNRGLQPEFRKFALIESKQYQNIPRTIANVFLNAKLDAEFVKETIIKSLNEEEIKIDLTQYSQLHFKDFEENLNDLKKWTEGRLDHQAKIICEILSAFQYVTQQKVLLSYQLGYAYHEVTLQMPQATERLHVEVAKREKIKEKQQEIAQVFEKKKSDIQKEIGAVSDKIKDCKKKQEEYQSLGIKLIIEKVDKKKELEWEKEKLTEEKTILTAEFLEIQQRYEAQLKQLENQFKEFENIQGTAINEKNSAFLTFKELTSKQYEIIFEEIRLQHKEQLEIAHNKLNDIKEANSDNRIKYAGIKQKRFYEEEINHCLNQISAILSSHLTIKNEIEKSHLNVEYLQNNWQSEELKLKTESERKIEKETEKLSLLKQQIEGIDKKIDSNKDSLYAWLNENIQNWENTIGKVIDEENILFQPGLNPIKTGEQNQSLYGVKINTNQIKKNVKSIADLKTEQAESIEKTVSIEAHINSLNSELNEEVNNLHRKYKNKISEQKNLIKTYEYQLQIEKTKQDALQVEKNDWDKKAKAHQASELAELDNQFNKLNEDKLLCQSQIQKIENNIQKSMDAKKKEKAEKLKTEETSLQKMILILEAKIASARENTEKQTQDIKNQQSQELTQKGANTERINAIDKRISEIGSDLNYIENNRDKVAEYYKDKRELFDKEEEFKTKKSLLEKQLQSEFEKQKQQEEKLATQLETLQKEISLLSQKMEAFKLDLEAFEDLSKTDSFESIQPYFSSFTNIHHTEASCKSIVSELYLKENTIRKRFQELMDNILLFSGNYSENNLFHFDIKFKEKEAYIRFAENLKEFLEEEKIITYKQRFENRFADIIRLIGKETNALIEKEGEISKVIQEINNDFVSRQFVSAIKSVELKTIESKNKIFNLLVKIKEYNDKHSLELGKPNLFSGQGSSNKNEDAISLLKQLLQEMTHSKEKEISLSDSFELQFKIIENDNDTGWVEKLSNVGSEGTDILVKAMINIMLLNVFKEKANKKQHSDFRLHCMMDEIGKLHPNNVKGILKFANDRNILLINSSPTSYNASDYRYTYILAKDATNITHIKRLVRKNTGIASLS